MDTRYRWLKCWVGMVAMLGLTMLAGCIVSLGSHSHHEHGCYIEDCLPSEGDPVFAEIHAAGRLGFDSSRVEALTNIARRPDLTPAAQTYLVRTTMLRVSFESSKQALLMALIKNPAFSHAAKRCILRHLSHLKFDATKTAILKAMRKRPAPAGSPDGETTTPTIK